MTSPVAHRSRQQRGVVLFVALIVMVAMSLAAIALFRSVDTANLVAGNQSLKQSALNSTDVGVVTAMKKFTTGGFLLTDANTYSDSAKNCYVATTLEGTNVDARGIPKLLLDPATLFTAYDATCKFDNANGDVVRYIIDRQCDISRKGKAANFENCLVATTQAKSGTNFTSHTGSPPIALHRVSVRVEGPRNTVSYVQAVIRP